MDGDSGDESGLEFVTVYSGPPGDHLVELLRNRLQHSETLPRDGNGIKISSYDVPDDEVTLFQIVETYSPDTDNLNTAQRDLEQGELVLDHSVVRVLAAERASSQKYLDSILDAEARWLMERWTLKEKLRRLDAMGGYVELEEVPKDPPPFYHPVRRPDLGTGGK